MGTIVLIIIQDWKFKLNHGNMWNGFNWENFNEGDKVFLDGGDFNLNHGDNCFQFIKQEEGTIYLSYEPTHPDYMNELFPHIKVVEF